MIRRPPRSTLFPLHDALPISQTSRPMLSGGRGTKVVKPVPRRNGTRHTADVGAGARLSYVSSTRSVSYPAQRSTGSGGERGERASGSARPQREKGEPPRVVATRGPRQGGERPPAARAT